MHNLKNIAEELKRLREDLTKKEFARRLGVEYRTYLRYEAGETSPPKTVIILAMYMSKITPNYTLLLESGYANLEKISSFIKNIELDENPEIAELLEGARKVLKSGNQVAYDALERNIRYFSHAIETEKRLQAMESRLEVFEKRLKAMPEENTEKKVM